MVADFSLPDQCGAPRRLSALLAAGTVVLFFYRQAGGIGCTKEVRHLRALEPLLLRAGARIVGVSPDPVERQIAFAKTTGIGFPLLSDEDGEIADRF